MNGGELFTPVGSLAAALATSSDGLDDALMVLFRMMGPDWSDCTIREMMSIRNVMVKLLLTAKKCTRKCWYLACISTILGLMFGASRIVRRDISLSHMHRLKQTVPQKCTASANGKNSEGGHSLTIPCIPVL
jgi:hypothetical protein